MCVVSFQSWQMPSLCFLLSKCLQPPKTTTTTGTKTSAKEEVVHDKGEGVHQRGWLRGEGLRRHKDLWCPLRCPGFPWTPQFRGAELGPQGHEADAGIKDWLCDETKQEQIKVKGSHSWCSVPNFVSREKRFSYQYSSESRGGCHNDTGVTAPMRWSYNGPSWDFV